MYTVLVLKLTLIVRVFKGVLVERELSCGERIRRGIAGCELDWPCPQGCDN